MDPHEPESQESEDEQSYSDSDGGFDPSDQPNQNLLEDLYGENSSQFAFNQSQSLNIHIEKVYLHSHTKPTLMNNVSEDKVYICHYCQKIFLQRKQIVNHMKYHDKQKYICEVCQRRLSTKVAFQNHMKIHSDKRELFSCKVCSRNFTTKNSRENHMNIHTKKKKYECQFCKKCFFDPGSLHKHTDIHKGVRYKCDICGVQYKSQQALKAHLGKHLGLTPPKQVKIETCDRCGQEFSSRHLLKVCLGGICLVQYKLDFKKRYKL